MFGAAAPARGRVISNHRLTPDQASDIRHLVLEVQEPSFRFLEGQSLGLVIPGLPDRGHASNVRFYSIASCRDGEENRPRRVAICVKRRITVDPETGREQHGLASDYVCNLAPGQEVAIVGPFGNSFLVPRDPASNLILIATGTGIAPFRAFLNWIFRGRCDWTGQVRLFQGCATAGESLYRDEIDSLESFPNFRVHHAFSRDEQTSDGHRLHVHHRLDEAIEDVWALLDRDNTYLYMCGLKGMEGPIEQVLERRAQRDQISWRSFYRLLQDSGRLKIETY